MRRAIFITAAALLAGCGDEPPGQRELESGIRDLQRGHFNVARTQLEKSIAARPGSERNIEALNYLGIANWRLGRTQDAMEAFESARRLGQITPEPTYNLGVLCAESGEPARGLQLLKEAALMDETDPRPLEYMGVIYAKRQQWPEARRSYYAARSRAPASPRILTSIALIEFETERPETAAATLQSALGHDPKYAPALFNLGLIHESRLHDPAQAQAYYKRFLSVTNAGEQADHARRFLAGAPAAGPAEPRPAPESRVPAAPTRAPPPALPAQPANFSAGVDLFAKAREAAGQARGEDALHYCLQAAQQAAARGDLALQERALRLGAQLCLDSARAHAELGEFLLARGQGEAALTSFRAATALDEGHARAFLGLGRAATAVREYDTALIGLKQAVQLDPSNPDALWLLAQLYEKQVEAPPQALKAYSDFLKLFPSDPRSTLARERVRAMGSGPRAPPPAEATRPAAARPEPAPAVAARPPPPPVERTPPSALPSKNAPEEVNPDAAAASRPAAAAERNPAAAHQAFSRAADYQRRGDWNNALYYYEQAVRNDDRLESAWFNLGAGYSLRGDTARAKDAYLRVLQLKPDYVEARYNLGVLYKDTKDYAAAEKLLADLAQRKPDYANAWLALGEIYARNPATMPQARAAYQKFLDLAPNSRSAPGVRQWLRAQ